MHSYVEFSMTASKLRSFAPTIEETVETGKWAQKAEMAVCGVELSPVSTDAARCDPVSCRAWAAAGSTARDATQLLAASIAPASHRARALCRIEVVVAPRGAPAHEVLISSAPWLRLPGVCSKAGRDRE
jgi:hypothetical protein